ncbi:MAG: hypothetical protein WBQ10_20100 [Terriglobales bacterium]
MRYLQFVDIGFLSVLIGRGAKSLILMVLLSGVGLAQAVSIATLNDGPPSYSPENSAPSASVPSSASSVAPNAVTAPTTASALPEAPSPHKFWDNENRALFTTVAALSAADFALTRSILQNGGKELNPVTRLFSGSTAGLAANFAGETAGIIGLSYFFHKTGHHQLERLTPMLNIGASAFAVIYDLNHR